MEQSPSWREPRTVELTIQRAYIDEGGYIPDEFGYEYDDYYDFDEGEYGGD